MADKDPITIIREQVRQIEQSDKIIERVMTMAHDELDAIASDFGVKIPKNGVLPERIKALGQALRAKSRR